MNPEHLSILPPLLTGLGELSQMSQELLGEKAWSEAAREAATAARKAAAHHEAQGSRSNGAWELTGQASRASDTAAKHDSGDHDTAMRAHQAAAESHSGAAEIHYTMGDATASKLHEEAATAHRRAVEAHAEVTGADPYGKRAAGIKAWSDAAREAARLSRQAKTQTDLLPGHPRTHEAQGYAKEAADHAADHDHLAAARCHERAAQAHQRATTRGGDWDQQNASNGHVVTYGYHIEAAQAHRKAQRAKRKES